MAATVHTKSPVVAVPAVWAAFAAQGRWKNWVIITQLFFMFFLIYANVALVQKQPDVVLVAPDGTSTYVERALVGDSVIRAIHAAKGLPDDLSTVRFSKDFIQLAFGIHSATAADAWEAALARMTLELRTKLAKEYEDQGVLKTFEMARIRTDLEFLEVAVVERTDKFIRVRALMNRQRASLVDGAKPPLEKMEVDLILRVAGRTATNPDGLEVATFGAKPIVDEVSQDHATSGAKAPLP